MDETRRCARIALLPVGVSGTNHHHCLYLIFVREDLRKVLEQLPDAEQEKLAQFLVREMAQDEEQWESAFAGSPDKLRKLGDEALRAYLSGETLPLDPDKL